MTYRIMLLVELTRLSDMSDNFVVMSLYTAVSLGSRLENGIMLLPILIMPCPSLALRRNE